MKQYIFAGGIFFMLIFIFNLSPINADISVTVSNFSDNLDGDTSSIPSLISNPGQDGSISFREALYACEKTDGPKQIQFAPELIGSKIIIDPTQDVLYLSSGELTINGDINNDNEPDVTLNGLLGQAGTPSGIGLAIVSSHNSIMGLVLEDFDSSAILMACPEPDCSTKNFSDNKIIGNKLSSQRANGPLIFIGVSGLSIPEYFPNMSGVTWRDIIISGNTFISDRKEASGAIALIPGAAGASENLIENVTISLNNLEGGVVAIQAAGMDCSSDYFGVIGPTNYSDGNHIKSLIIEKNVITNNVEAIGLSAANDGGRSNQLVDIKILDNQISRSTTGITVHVAGWGDSQRSTADNLISNVEIRQNTVTETLNGIELQVGHDPKDWHGMGSDNNSLNNIQIIDNNIQDYTGSGIQIYGGFSDDYQASNNTLDTLTVENNQILTNNGLVGLKLIGGHSIQGIAQENKLQGVTISNNVLSGNNIGIWLIGGQGLQSNANSIFISRINANTVNNNIEGTRITENDEGASGNVVEINEDETDGDDGGDGGDGGSGGDGGNGGDGDDAGGGGGGCLIDTLRYY